MHFLIYNECTALRNKRMASFENKETNQTVLIVCCYTIWSFMYVLRGPYYNVCFQELVKRITYNYSEGHFIWLLTNVCSTSCCPTNDNEPKLKLKNPASKINTIIQYSYLTWSKRTFWRKRNSSSWRGFVSWSFSMSFFFLWQATFSWITTNFF